MGYSETPKLNGEVDGAAAQDGTAFRLAMREFASGVTIVTADADGERIGCTATSVCSLSLDPPSLLVCMAKGSRTLAALRASGAFGVNILSAAHEDQANSFAGRGRLRGPARFSEGDWTQLVTGAPMLADALASIDCRLEDVIERHTHAIVIGRVAEARRVGGAAALIHWRSRFTELS